MGLKDIKIWLDENDIAESEMTKNAIVDKYFEEGNYPMELIESRLSKLIFDFNNEDQELTNLMNNY